MLKRNGQMISEEANHGIWGAPSVEPFAYFSNVIRRRLSLFFALMTMSIVLAVIYLFNTAPIYVATASMAIDVDQVKSLEPRAGNELVVDFGLDPDADRNPQVAVGESLCHQTIAAHRRS